MSNLHAFFNTFIKKSLLIYFGVVLFYVIRDNNFSITGVPNPFFAILTVVIGVLTVVALNKKLRAKILHALLALSDWKYINAFSLVLFVVMILWQVTMVFLMATPVGFDVGGVFQSVANPRGWGQYFSENPNQWLFYTVMKFFSDMFGNTWYVWDFANLVFIDVAIALHYFVTGRYFNKRISLYSTLALAILIGFAPTVLIPYTDTFVLPFAELLLLLIGLITQSKSKIVVLWYLLFIVDLTTLYLMKPSTMIFFIALMVLALFAAQNYRSFLKRALGIVVIMLAMFGLSRAFNASFVANSSFNIDKTQAKPMSNFLLLGSSGNVTQENGGVGDWNMADYKLVMMDTKPKDRNHVILSELKNRISSRGVDGNIKFLILKTKSNTSDGTLGWGKEGGFLDENASANHSGIAKYLQSLYYPNGSRRGIVTFVSQIFWLLLTAMIFASLLDKKRDAKVDYLRLVLFGGLLFLLLFEGGRSRYLIQYLPVFTILSAIGFSKILEISKSY